MLGLGFRLSGFRHSGFRLSGFRHTGRRLGYHSRTTHNQSVTTAAAPSRLRWPQSNPPMSTQSRPLRVAILGAGTIGAEVARGFLRNPDRRIGPAGGRMLELVAIAELNVQSAVDRGMPRDLIVPDAAAAIARSDVDIIVELIGGEEPARSLIAAALSAGKPVVTANTLVLALHGAELESLARANGV